MLKHSILFVLLVTFCAWGCNRSTHDTLWTHLSAADIKVLDNHSGQSQHRVIRLSSQEALRQLSQSISSSKAPTYKCGYTGELTLFYKVKTKAPQTISFNSSPQCPHAVMLDSHGELASYRLTAEGVKYLQSVIGQH